MSNYPPALTAHVRRDVTTLCHCWRVLRRDGAVFGFTDHDRALTVAGTACQPDSGMIASEARKSLGMAVDTMDVEGAFSSSAIEAGEVSAGKFDGATVEVWLVNWRKPEDAALLRVFAIARITSADGRFVAELQSRMAALDRPNGRHIARGCDAEFGDGRCGMSLANPAYRGTGVVSAVLADGGVSVAGLGGYAPGWFIEGRIDWTSGANSGLADVAVDDRLVDGERRLMLRGDCDGPVSAGDTFAIAAGCDKAFPTCKSKFANALNFRGFPHLPGNDVAYNYATSNGAHDGKPIVP